MTTEESLQTEVLGQIILARLIKLEAGWHVVLVGGIQSHVGSMSYAVPNVQLVSLNVPGHKDHVIGDKWARVLADQIKQPVSVACGIHYDHATPEQITCVIQACDALLDEALKKLATIK